MTLQTLLSMPVSDIFAVVQWWFVFFVLGLTFFPVTAYLFAPFKDRGYAFAKILGTIVVSYVVFVLGILNLVPFTTPSVYGIFFLLGLLNLYFFGFKRRTNITTLLPNWRLYLFEELLFFLALFAWSYIRAFTPEIYGLEKYMDFGFVNSILRAEYFPPKDMWFTPFSINYYYFGHLITAVLIKAAQLPGYIAYNIMIATLFALSFIQTFSLGINLWFAAFGRHDAHGNLLPNASFKPRARAMLTTGILSATLVTLAGNLHIIHAFFTAYENETPKPLWELLFNPSGFPNAYWYPNATRFIYNTIHEFPIYSWVVADLHGHVLDVPGVLLIIALLFSFLLQHKQHIAHFLFIGFLLAVMYTTNAWDGGIYLLLAGFVVFQLQWQRVFPAAKESAPNPVLSLIPKTLATKTKRLFHKRPLIDFFAGLALYGIVMLSSFIVFTLPFNTFFNPTQIVSGVGVLCAPSFLTDIKSEVKTPTGETTTVTGKVGPLLFEKDHCQKSPWWQLMTLYGFFYFFVVTFMVFLRKRKDITASDVYVSILIVLATLLIIIPEFIYMKDIYPAHYRANTMFKLVFQAFIMLALCSAYIIMRTLVGFKNDADNLPKKLLTTGYMLLVTLMLALVYTYPVMAVKSYYGNLQNYQGLDGLTYLKNKNSDDYEAVMWLNKNISGQPVIAEAQGDSYTDYARISANTGLPTILGWTVHEWLWRGSYDVPAPRITEIQTLYETTDSKAAENIIEKFKVAYIVVGNLEREKYPSISVEKFTQLGKPVFQRGTTTIYQVN